MSRADHESKSWATAGSGKLCFTLNYHLSTLNFLSTTASGWLHRLVRPWLPLKGSHVLGFRRWRWLLVRYIYNAPPLPIGIKAPQ